MQQTYDLPYVYKGKSAVIANVPGTFCEALGEIVFDADESTRVSRLMLEFNKQVNTAVT